MTTPRTTADIVRDLRTVAKDTEALAVHTTNSTRHKNEMIAARLMTEAANRLEAEEKRADDATQEVEDLKERMQQSAWEAMGEDN